MSTSSKSRFLRLRDALIFFIGAVLFLYLLRFGTSVFISIRDSLTAVPAPIIDSPQLTLKKKSLIDKPYFVPSAPFAEYNYSQIPRIIFRGPFSEIKLTATGTLATKEPNFFIFGFNNETGIIDGFRTARNKISPSEEKKSVIDENGNFMVSVNLFSEKLGTSSKEFEVTSAGTRDFHFIQKNNPADSAKILLAPFNNNGQYGGTLDSLTIEYLCIEEDEGCKVEKCLPNEKTTECLTRFFSPKEAEAWRQRTGL